MNNPRTFNAAQREALHFIAGGLCASCGVELTQDNYHADHVQPHSKGGETDVTNGQALCATCNLRKGNKMDEQLNTELNTSGGEATDGAIIGRQRPVAVAIRSMYEWQNRFVAALQSKIAAGGDTFMLYATPGTGKTRGSLQGYDAVRNKIGVATKKPFLLVLAPSKAVRDGWCNAAAEISADRGDRDYVIQPALTLDTVRLAEKGGILGVALTYQGAASSATQEKIAALAQHFNLFVIADEAHWLQDHPDARWGKWGKAVVNMAPVFYLLLSGTPYRTGYNEQIVLCPDNAFAATPDFEFTYDDALKAGIVPDVVISHHGGKITHTTVQRDVLTGVVLRDTHGPMRTTKDLPFDDPTIDACVTDPVTGVKDYADLETMNERLRVALWASYTATNKADGVVVTSCMAKFLTGLLDKAAASLSNARRDHRNAGGLVICYDTKQAFAVYEYLHSKGLTVRKAYTTSGEDNLAVINAFKNSTDEWLVAVKMVSEGVDITRLRTLVYASRITTKRYFDQAIGRLFRVDGVLDRDAQPVTCFIPRDPRLVDWSQTFSEPTRHYVNSAAASVVAKAAVANAVSAAPSTNQTYEETESVDGEAVDMGGTINKAIWGPGEAEAYVAAYLPWLIFTTMMKADTFVGVEPLMAAKRIEDHMRSLRIAAPDIDATIEAWMRANGHTAAMDALATFNKVAANDAGAQGNVAA